MPNVIPQPTLFQRRINNYVPSMQYAMDVNSNGFCRIGFGSPPAAVANNILNALALSATAQTLADLTANTNAQTITAPFGRTMQLVLSLAGTGTATVRGGDYLGQLIAENVALNGLTVVETKKAYKYVDSVTFPAIAGAPTVNMGWGTSLGLPYHAMRVTAESANGLSVATLGTFVAGALADPQSLTTADPRGIYKPTTALNGANIITATFDMDNDVNSSNNGGLHGIRHFFQ